MATRVTLDDAQVLAQHKRVLDGDSTAIDLVTGHLLDACTASIENYCHCDRDTASEVVVPAILEYLATPVKFDPRRMPLTKYIAFAARRNLVDRVRSEQSRRKREFAWATLMKPIAAGRTAVLACSEDIWPALMRAKPPLSDADWLVVRDILRVTPSRGTRRRYSSRQIFESILGLLRHHGQWIGTSGPSPSRQICRAQFHIWCRGGVLQQALDALEQRHQRRLRTPTRSRNVSE